MFHIVLYQPEIPPNTGNVMRLCANIGARLHLIRPLGFALEDKKLRRAGLDYREWVNVHLYKDLEEFMERIQPTRLLAFSTRGQRRYSDMRYQENDALLFGPETRGLPRALLDQLPPEHRLTLPMLPGNRSLNLSNAVAVAAFEAWRQHNFIGANISPGSNSNQPKASEADPIRKGKVIE
jgi:tRNA (cytidine/uridine-2'-O-)-methyltransferase